MMTVRRLVHGPRAGIAVVAVGCTQTPPLGVDRGSAGVLPKRIAYLWNSSLDVLEFLVSADNLEAHRVTGSLTHFSSYAIAW